MIVDDFEAMSEISDRMATPTTMIERARRSEGTETANVTSQVYKKKSVSERREKERNTQSVRTTHLRRHHSPTP